MTKGIYYEGRDGFLICIPTLYSPRSAPEGHYAVTLYTVAPNRMSGYEWADKKEIMAEKLLDLAEEKIPGLKEQYRGDGDINT